ncbi:hypothetical protein B0T22DRAFT_40396 [Podospora appendiculata]|uniref:Cellobiose dehydrogenase-like cytochrome domain-containing protein n=1 Tax=Podospora appendiculata TaxID=314037 RepID=A0AAE0XHP2_9PEZI|nr:hypothetical protein B0T22DRAFT_40396 [Podospora appendiculata]
MRLLNSAIITTALLASGVFSAPSPSPDLDKRQTTSKYCDAKSSVCYLQVQTTSLYPIFRIAIPDVTSTSFDTLLQIVAPVSLGWAGFSWGGGMTLNPLTVAWPNGNKATVSSRWATGRLTPSVYSGATYKTLSSSKNATHWAIEVACTGCSKWNGGNLDNNGINTFAWAVSKTPVAQPASSSSSFSVHNNVGTFAADLTTAKVPQSVFQQHIKSP